MVSAGFEGRLAAVDYAAHVVLLRGAACTCSSQLRSPQGGALCAPVAAQQSSISDLHYPYTCCSSAAGRASSLSPGEASAEAAAQCPALPLRCHCAVRQAVDCVPAAGARPMPATLCLPARPPCRIAVAVLTLRQPSMLCRYIGSYFKKAKVRLPSPGSHAAAVFTCCSCCRRPCLQPSRAGPAVPAVHVPCQPLAGTAVASAVT